MGCGLSKLCGSSKSEKAQLEKAKTEQATEVAVLEQVVQDMEAARPQKAVKPNGGTPWLYSYKGPAVGGAAWSDYQEEQGIMQGGKSSRYAREPTNTPASVRARRQKDGGLDFIQPPKQFRDDRTGKMMEMNVARRWYHNDSSADYSQPFRGF